MLRLLLYTEMKSSLLLMNSTKILFGLLSAVLINLTFFSAGAEKTKSASIKFEETIFDFGTIKEDGGPVTHEFRFTNTGDGSLIINSARAECGCTKPQYSEKPIAPGKSGVIKVTYHPAGRPGGFSKTITVRCNGNPGKVVLKIRGTVVPAAKTLSMRYPVAKGSLRMETDIVKAGELQEGQRRHSFVGLYNNGSQTITPLFTTDSKALDLNVTPKSIAPGETATLDLYLNSARIDKPGLQQIKVKGEWGNTPADTIVLSYRALILPAVMGPRNIGKK